MDNHRVVSALAYMAPLSALAYMAEEFAHVEDTVLEGHETKDQEEAEGEKDDKVPEAREVASVRFGGRFVRGLLPVRRRDASMRGSAGAGERGSRREEPRTTHYVRW